MIYNLERKGYCVIPVRHCLNAHDEQRINTEKFGEHPYIAYEDDCCLIFDADWNIIFRSEKREVPKQFFERIGLLLPDEMVFGNNGGKYYGKYV